MCVTCNSLGVVGGGGHKSLEPFPEVGDTDGGNASLVYQRGKSDCTINTAKQAINGAREGRGQRRVRARSRAEVADEAMPPWLGAPCLHPAPTLNPAEPSPLVPQLGGGAGTTTDGSCCQSYSFKGARHLPPEIGQPWTQRS